MYASDFGYSIGLTERASVTPTIGKLVGKRYYKGSAVD